MSSPVQVFTPPLEAIRSRARSATPLPAAARRPCIILACIALIVTVVMLALPRSAAAQGGVQPVRGEASLSTTGGYARLIIRLGQEVDSQVRLSSGILVINFKRPVDVPIDRVNVGATDWIGVARRDPDGRGLRFALSRKVRLNTMTAGERLYVDLLPDDWKGDPPGLPTEVVQELNQRARDAERKAREQIAAAAAQKKIPVVRVRVARQPTFTRFTFDLPDVIGVTTDRSKDKLTLIFAGALKFDLVEAKLNAPNTVGSIDAAQDGDTSEVRFTFAKPIDLRSFREDFTYVVDVIPIEAKPIAPPSPVAGIEPPDTVVMLPDGGATLKAPAAGVTPSASPQAKSMPVAGDDPAKPAPEAKDATPPPSAAAMEPPDPKRAVAVEIRRQGDNLRVLFPFVATTPAAIFQRADTLWLVFDTPAKVDVSALETEPSHTVKSATVKRDGDVAIVRLKLERPRLSSATVDKSGWTVTIGETMADQTKPLVISRNIVSPTRTSITIPFDDPRALHPLDDPDIGDTLYVVTGAGPARGFLRTQDFVEFRALASTQGIVIQPFADDIKIELSADKVLIGRPHGLTLSEAAGGAQRSAPPRAVVFDSGLWNSDRDANFAERQTQLIAAAAAAPPNKRINQRLDLARFYLAREMFAEAKAVLDVTIADDHPTAENPTALVLRAIAYIMLGRNEAALKDLANPLIGNNYDAQMWRAFASARQGKWAEAREGFSRVEGAIAALPLELQRLILVASLRSSIEIGDFATAAVKMNDIDSLGVPSELEPGVSVLTGRLAEGLGRNSDALTAYRFAAESMVRPAAAQGRLREVVLRYAIGDEKKNDVINDLEILTTIWRGDDTEAEALQLLARLYTQENRYRDAFNVMRTATTAHPTSETTRHIMDEASATFDGLFLGGKGDKLPAVEALSLFYDFRELTPMGRRGDEMIRRLSDRLASVDLLDQAAELLQYQVDNRLQGAARAQVATKLAVIYLLNHKPEKAQATLRATRTADVSRELRSQRLLLEARALSDLGRHNLALEVIANTDDREAVRLRADVYWAARRWQPAAEQIELLYGDRFRDFTPLTDAERSDILRAGIGFALGDDRIGTARLREKYAAKMAEGPDRRAFDVVTGGMGVNSAEFRDVARQVAAIDTLEGFLRDLRARYPEMNATVPDPAGAPASPAATAGPRAPRSGSPGAALPPGADRTAAR